MQEGKKILASGGSAVGLSLFASLVGLCCIGPWTVALLKDLNRSDTCPNPSCPT
jgi:hypothetical protein